MQPQNMWKKNFWSEEMWDGYDWVFISMLPTAQNNYVESWRKLWVPELSQVWLAKNLTMKLWFKLLFIVQAAMSINPTILRWHWLRAAQEEVANLWSGKAWNELNFWHLTFSCVCWRLLAAFLDRAGWRRGILVGGLTTSRNGDSTTHTRRLNHQRHYAPRYVSKSAGTDTYPFQIFGWQGIFFFDGTYLLI